MFGRKPKPKIRARVFLKSRHAVNTTLTYAEVVDACHQASYNHGDDGPYTSALGPFVRLATQGNDFWVRIRDISFVEDVD